MNFVGEFKKVEKQISDDSKEGVKQETTTDKLLREITDLRMIYNEVLNELDVLKGVINDIDMLKGELNIVKGSLENNSKSLIEYAERINAEKARSVKIEEKKKDAGLKNVKKQPLTTLPSGRLIITKRK